MYLNARLSTAFLIEDKVVLELSKSIRRIFYEKKKRKRETNRSVSCIILPEVVVDFDFACLAVDHPISDHHR